MEPFFHDGVVVTKSFEILRDFFSKEKKHLSYKLNQKSTSSVIGLEICLSREGYF